MLPSRSFIAMLVLVGLGAPVFGQDTVDLKWKFDKGKTFYQEMTTKTTQNLKVMGMPVTQNQEQTFFFSWTPKDEDKDHNWTITQKIEGVRMKIEIGGNPINFDSTKDTAATNPLSEFFKAIVGSEFTLTVSPANQVTKVEGRDKFLEKLVAAHQQMKPLLEQILTDDALKQMADPAFAVAHDKVKKGDTWDRPPATLNMGPIGTYKTSYKYTYEGKENNLDKVSVVTTLEYTPPGDMGTATTLPFRIKSADLKSKDPKGTIFFDSAKGRVDNSSMSLSLDGKLSIEISGMTTEVELSQTQETTVKTTDTNPVAAKPAS